MELFRALAALAEPPAPEVRRLAGALELGPLPEPSDYTSLFIFQLYPYASVYLGTEGMLGGEARDRAAGFWRALGQMPPAEPDHLSVMLALYARLVELEEDERDAAKRHGWRGARRSYLWEHLLSWLPVYLVKLDQLAPPFYRKWGEILSEALTREAGAAGEQDSLPLHLRDASPLVHPEAEGLDAFAGSLLAPVRSGMILARVDFNRAAEQFDMGLRPGTRRQALTALLTQAPEQTLDWLARESATWAQHHRSNRARFGKVATNWEARAEAATAFLERLKRDFKDA